MNNQALQALLYKHLSTYPKATAQDVLKLLFQREFGSGHLMGDPVKSLRLLEAEREALSQGQADAPAVEPLGNGICRVHLRILNQTTLQASTLHRLFFLTASRLRGSKEAFAQAVDVAVALCQAGELPLLPSDLVAAYATFTENGGQLFRHSETYRSAYAPAYRVIEQQYCDFLPLFAAIDAQRGQHKPLMVSLDGRCASGKTTLAALLEAVYGCGVVHMDHFFLRPEQRTPERMAEAGGNVDYERIAQTVLPAIAKGEQLTYRPYDCATGTLAAPVQVDTSRMVVVEGSYSQHPALVAAYHVKVFLTVLPKEQLQRIRARNGAEMLKRFQSTWIPMEEAYFSAFSVEAACDLCFDTEHVEP